MLLSDKHNILINSAGSNLGRAIAMHFCSIGCNVILLEKDIKKLQKTYDFCNTISNKLIKIHNDSNQSITKNIGKYLSKFKCVHICINCFCITTLPKKYTVNSINYFCKKFTNTLASNFNLIQSFKKNLNRKNESGIIINIPQFQPQNVCFELSLAISEDMTKSWLTELEHENIRIDSIISQKFGINSEDQLSIQSNIINNIDYIILNDYINGRVIKI